MVTYLYPLQEERNQSMSLTLADSSSALETFLTIAILGQKPSLGCYFIFIFYYYIFLLNSI